MSNQGGAPGRPAGRLDNAGVARWRPNAASFTTNRVAHVRSLSSRRTKQDRFMSDEAWWDKFKFMDYMLDFDPCHRCPRTASSGKVPVPPTRRAQERWWRARGCS